MTPPRAVAKVRLREVEAPAAAVPVRRVRKAYEQEIDGVLVAFEKGYEELQDNERSLKTLMEQQKSEAMRTA